MGKLTDSVRLPVGALVPAPVSGVQLGLLESGPLAVRLYRLAGTRVAFASAMLPAQLLAIRAAAAGTPVQVVTNRPQFWQPLVPDGRGLRVVPTLDLLESFGGPSLLVDDRPAQARTAYDNQPWQCRLDVRTDWSPAELASFAYSDLAVFGGIPSDFTASVASVFGVPARATERLAHLEPGVCALLRRGRLEWVTLDPTPAERHLLDAARGVGVSSMPAPPIWR
jgi:hypothetical protein